MKTKIAVVTVNGKAYYKLLQELKERKMLFTSLIPGETISPTIQVVITTIVEKPKIIHPNILVFNPENDASSTIDKVSHMILRIKTFDEVVVGVDPGKTIGVALLADGKVLLKDQVPTIEILIKKIMTQLKRNPANVQIIKIGSGIFESADDLASRLDIVLPKDCIIELVGESGTSNIKGQVIRKKVNHSESAVEIARKKGSSINRRKVIDSIIR
jgi:hypothetical protein